MENNTFQFSIRKNIELFCNDPLTVKQRDGKMPLVELEKNRPLVLLLTWMNAKRKHTRKFVDLYLDKGFAVLNISSSVWHCIWPMTGAQVSASNVLEFLYDNKSFEPVFAHGFSCGGYVWSEVLAKCSTDMEKYEPTLSRVKGQVFDSPPGIPPAFQKGFALALFPNNYILSFIFEYAITVQLYLFYNIVTKHLINGYDIVCNPPMKIPSLMFFSKDDPISPFELNSELLDTWKKRGIETRFKCWDNSPHVGHFVQHQEEYLENLDKFLESIGIHKLSEEKKVGTPSAM